MKKEKIYNIVIASICFFLLVLPIRSFEFEGQFDYVCIIGSFIVGCKDLFFFSVRDFITILLACLSIALLTISIFKNKLAIKISATISTSIYIIMWSIISFDTFPIYGAYILLLIFYIALITAIVALTVLQYLKYIPPRRPTKAERLQSQIDELQKQVDELKKGD